LGPYTAFQLHLVMANPRPTDRPGQEAAFRSYGKLLELAQKKLKEGDEDFEKDFCKKVLDNAIQLGEGLKAGKEVARFYAAKGRLIGFNPIAFQDVYPDVKKERFDAYDRAVALEGKA